MAFIDEAKIQVRAGDGELDLLTLRQVRAIARRIDDAEAALLESFEILKQTFDERHVTTRQTISELIRLYELQDNSEQEQKWRSVLERSESSGDG